MIKRVYSYVAYRIGDQEAEDLTAEVFERAVRYRASYDPGKGNAVAWVLGIARTVVSDYQARGHASPAERMPTDRSFEGPEEAVVQRITLQQALATLSDRDQEVLSLRYGADLKARELARVLGVTTHAAEVAISRALGRLREISDFDPDL